MSTALKASPEHGLSPGTALRDPGRQPWGQTAGQLPTLVTVNTKQRGLWPGPRRAGGVAHRLCTPSAQTRDTPSVFVGKLAKFTRQIPPASLCLCLSVSGSFRNTGKRPDPSPARVGHARPSCVSRSPWPSREHPRWGLGSRFLVVPSPVRHTHFPGVAHWGHCGNNARWAADKCQGPSSPRSQQRGTPQSWEAGLHPPISDRESGAWVTIARASI